MNTPLRIAVVYPDLLGTYGDGGNGVILTRRAQWRGFDVELVQAHSHAPLPEADVYCLGGGEDGPQVRAAHSLIDDGTLLRRVAGGAVVLAVCAGYQIVGKSFPGADGTPFEGVGLLDIITAKGAGPRAVGELVAETQESAVFTLPTLTGFENHAAVTTLTDHTDQSDHTNQPRTTSLARTIYGVGNGDGSGTEGAVCGRVIGTYLHGPVLARNPALADLILAWALDVDPGTLAPLDDNAADDLRRDRLEATTEPQHGRAGRRARRRSRPS